jgi:hypothetical protein
MSAAEVVAKAKDNGMKIARAFVYQVRGRTSASAAKARIVPVTGPASAMSKADFIRSLPSSSAKEVVAEGKARGISLSENHVHAVRANDKSRDASRPTAVKTTKVASTRNGTRTFSPAAEDLLKAVAAELGLGRSLEILNAERARVKVVLGR